MSNRNFNIFIILAFIFPILFRISYIPPRGGDTLGMVTLWSTTTKLGYGGNIVHFLSYYGFYPFSYPIGEVFFLASTELVTGLQVSQIVFSLPIIFSIMGLLIFLLTIREFGIRRRVPIILIIFIYVMNRDIIELTWNKVTVRGLFIVIYPLILFFLVRLRHLSEQRLPYFLLLLISIFAISSIHRMSTFLFGIVVLPFIFLIIFEALISYSGFQVNRKRINIFVSLCIFFGLILQVVGVIDPLQVSEGYPLPFTIQNNQFSLVIKALFNYLIAYNISVIFLPIGLFYILSSNNSKFTSTYVLFMILPSTIFILDHEYFRPFFAPLATIIMGLGLNYVLENKNYFLQYYVFISLFFPSLIFLYYYYQDSYYILLLFSFSLLILLVFTNLKLIQDLSKTHHKINFLVLAILVSAPYMSYVTHYQSLEAFEEYDQGHGIIMGEQIKDNKAFWVREYISEKDWVCDHTAVRNSIWGVSGIPPSTSYLETARDHRFYGRIETEFNASMIFTPSKSLYDYEYGGLNPSYADYDIFYYPQLDYAQKLMDSFFVEWLIYAKGANDNSTVERNVMLPYSQEEQYLVYSASTIDIYYNKYYGR